MFDHAFQLRENTYVKMIMIVPRQYEGKEYDIFSVLQHNQVALSIVYINKIIDSIFIEATFVYFEIDCYSDNSTWTDHAYYEICQGKRLIINIKEHWDSFIISEIDEESLPEEIKSKIDQHRLNTQVK